MSEKEILYLSQEDVNRVLTVKDTIEEVEKGIKILGEGRAIQPQKVYMEIEKYHGFIKPMIAFVGDPVNISATKNFTYFPENRQKGLPTVSATIILNDPRTGRVLSIMDGTLITAYRTSATSAIGAKYLAKEDSEVIGIVGAGVQGRTHVMCLNEIFDIKKVKITDINKSYRDKAAEDLKEQLDLDVESVETYREVSEGSDIVATCTTGKGEFVKKEWVTPGMTVIKMGSYQEIDFGIVSMVDKLVIDLWEYMFARVPEIRDTGTKREDVIEIADIVVGREKGRESDNERNLFLSLGMGVEDAMPALYAYKEAKRLGIGQILKP